VANHPSAIKRYRQSRKRRTANQAAKARIRTVTRKLESSSAIGNVEQAKKDLYEASRALAKAASKGLIHSRTASRRTSRLAKKIAKLSPA
jgi:small subunit ribosomal protein S20